jgi:hypothetical protein
MEFIIRMTLMFFFVQFLVVSTIMVVALLLARTEGVVSQPGPNVLSRSFVSVANWPSRIVRSVVRLVRS